ncbi:MAG: hypothetical protein JW913_12815 [Chitinispirillaceae bacterium]|nr:hypothetical protein [Chitinispirillaceae bacterium]
MLKPYISAVSLFLFVTTAVLPAETIKNIDYAGTGKVEHTLNIYAPGGNGPFPVVIHYTGLAYSWSDAKGDGGLAGSYNAAGIIVVGANLSGGGSGSHMAHYPTQIQELKATVRFLRANADKYKINPDFIGVIGFSSGAWNSTILATTGDVDEFTVGSTTMNLEGEFGGNIEFSSRVQASWAAASPTDFLAMDGCGSMLQHNPANSPEGGLIGGQLDQNKDKCALANPITFISKDDPPIHLVHGTADNIVPTCQSELMWAALQKSGNQKDLSYSPVGGGHQANFGGSLDFFKKALAANKEGCLDPESNNFDPLATYCGTGECCTITAGRTARPSAVGQLPAALVRGLELVNTGAEAVTFTVFDVAGHVVTTGQLAAHGSFNLGKTGSGLRLCVLQTRNGGAYHYRIVCP